MTLSTAHNFPSQVRNKVSRILIRKAILGVSFIMYHAGCERTFDCHTFYTKK